MGLLDYHIRRSSKKIRSKAEELQIEWTEAEVYSNIDHDLSFASKHVLSHCHLSVIPLILRSRRETKKHSVGSILANRVERREDNLLFLEGLPCGNRVRPLWVKKIENRQVWSIYCILYKSMYKLDFNLTLGRL